MSSGIKQELKVEEKLGTQGTRGMDEFEQPVPRAMYTCANCTTQVQFSASDNLRCPYCEFATGSSTVFYKLRTQATTYDTI